MLRPPEVILDLPVAGEPAPWPRTELPRGTQLLTPQGLWRLMHSRDGPVPRGCLVFEVGEGAAPATGEGHVPGAGYLDIRALETAPMWTRRPDAELRATLAGLGITQAQTLVLYGCKTAMAARAAHLMLVLGVRDVRLLDGGWAAWQRAGLPVEQGAHPRATPAADFGRAVGRPGYVVDTQGLKQRLLRPGHRLVSIRTWDEFIGRTSGYDYIAARGEIPGALWGHAGDNEDMNSVSAFHDALGQMKPAAEILALWRGAGVSPGDPVTFYCGTGWRASVAFFYAWLMGWDDIAVYDGGWLAWSSDPANPQRGPLLDEPMQQERH